MAKATIKKSKTNSQVMKDFVENDDGDTFIKRLEKT